MGFSYAKKEVVIHMASRIQGITVEIGGDTTKLSKALESVNKSIKGTQSVGSTVWLWRMESPEQSWHLPVPITILQNLYFDADKFLEPIKGVKVGK